MPYALHFMLLIMLIGSVTVSIRARQRRLLFGHWILFLPAEPSTCGVRVPFIVMAAKPRHIASELMPLAPKGHGMRKHFRRKPCILTLES